MLKATHLRVAFFNGFNKRHNRKISVLK